LEPIKPTGQKQPGSNLDGSLNAPFSIQWAQTKYKGLDSYLEDHSGEILK
jgi:hypothetical protein